MNKPEIKTILHKTNGTKKLQKEVAKTYIVLDKEEYIVGEEITSSRILLTIDYHNRTASLKTLYNDETFMFKRSKPERIELIGELIRIAGDEAKKRIEAIKKRGDTKPTK